MTVDQINSIGGGINSFLIQDTIRQTQSSGGRGRVALGQNNPELRQYARALAARNGLDPDIVEHQLQQESGFRVDAVGPQTQYGRARGIAQMMPDTAKRLGIDPMDPRQAIGGMITMDKDALARYGGDWRSVLAEYNGGPGAVTRLRNGKPWEETQEYLTRVLGEGGGMVAAGSGAPGPMAGTIVNVQPGAVVVTAPITAMGNLDPQTGRWHQHADWDRPVSLEAE
jgi:hypothetical protein